MIFTVAVIIFSASLCIGDLLFLIKSYWTEKKVMFVGLTFFSVYALYCL